MPEREDSKSKEFHRCICSKLKKLTRSEELGQSWRSISVCISFGDYKKTFKIHKQDLLSLSTDNGNTPGNAGSQVERNLEEPEEEFPIAGVQSMVIPILPTTYNQDPDSNDQLIDVTTRGKNIKSEINETELDSELEQPTLEVPLLSANSTFRIPKKELLSPATEIENLIGNTENPVDPNLKQPKEEFQTFEESTTTVPIVPKTSKPDSNDQSINVKTTEKNSKRKTKRMKLDSELEPLNLKKSVLPSNSAYSTETRPNVEPLSSRTSKSASKTRQKINQCSICFKEYSNKYILKTHQNMKHSDEQAKVNWRYECDVCFKKFFRLADLNQHELAHSKVKKFKCPNCPNTYKWKGQLVHHLTTHKKASPFRCNLCHKLLSSSHKLQRHIRAHTLETPYKCKICSKSYVDLKEHLKLVHFL